MARKKTKGTTEDFGIGQEDASASPGDEVLGVVFGEGQPITAAQASAILEALDRNPTEIKASVAGVLERFGFVSAPRRHPPAPPQPPAPTPPASRVRQMVRRSEAARERGEKLPDIVEKALSEQAEAS